MKIFRAMKSSRGMTLLEVAIALAILGIITAATADLYDRAAQQKKIQTTHENIDAITLALSVYAETAGRVPCPADPSKNDLTFGWEYGVTTDMLKINNNTIVSGNTISHFPVGYCGNLGSGDGTTGENPTEGIVPFLTLGLPAKTALDGWGHYFTYAVSPVFARHNDQVTAQLNPATYPAPQDYGTIHGRCRHYGWVSTIDKKNRNPVKARFCCADQGTSVSPYGTVTTTYSAPAGIEGPQYDSGTDLVINFTDKTTTLSPNATNIPNTIRVTAGPSTAPTLSNGPTQYGTDPGTPVYNDINKTTLQTLGGIAVPSIDKSPVEAPAFILISHGANGYGAYLANNSATRITGGSLIENYNIHNAAIDASSKPYVDGPLSGAFGDIVRWMTQDGLMAVHGASSCQYP